MSLSLPGSSLSSAILFLLHLLVIFTIYSTQLSESIRIVETDEQSRRHVVNASSVPALFVFGDSTVDSGNNNYINTSFKSNFPPYGKDFPNRVATGRFTNGRLVTDFIFSYALGKDHIPAYLDPSLSLDDMITGVCFASAGSGYDPLTAQLSAVISIKKQLDYFKEYKTKLEHSIGKERTQSLIRKAIFITSAGTNDFIVNYYGAPIRRKTYTVSDYEQFIIQLGLEFIQGLVELGAKNIAFVGLPPIGCVPAVITLNSDNAFSHRGCIESLTSVSRDYNRILQKKLATLEKQNPGSKIVYVDIYKPLDDMIKNPHQFGFDRVNRGCCGSGLFEAGFLCNAHTVVCSDDTKYVFWDSIHPTEATYYKIFEYIRPIVDIFLK